MLASEYKKYLRKGERFFIVSIANTIDQAKISLQSTKDLINNSPILKPLIIRETTDTLELSNGAVFKALPASSRGGRGLTCPLVIFDEIGHAIDTPDGNAAGSSLFAALSPTTKRFPGLGKILMLSTPWVQQGVFWEKYKQASSGKFPSMQLIQLPTWACNPFISEESLETEKLANPELFAIEYCANFSQSLASFLEPGLVDASVNRDRTSLRPLNKFRGQYVLSLDPAKGGAGRDSYTACIAHHENEKLVVDLFHQFKPSYKSGDGGKQQISIAEVETWIQEYHQIYQFHQVVLDQYNSQSTIQNLKNLVPIEELTWTVKSKTQAFSKMRELFNSGNIDLYFHEKAIQQLKNSIVTYRAGGTWSVSGGAGANVDDFVSALAGAILIATQKPIYNLDWIRNL